jgi:hypothetical protein
MFDGIEYLRFGTERQRQAYDVLIQAGIFQKLEVFRPILAGTIPLTIDIEGSDLDILCCFENATTFTDTVTREFLHLPDFRVKTKIISGHTSVVANFSVLDFPVEIFGQGVPVKDQMAYRHLLIEHQILKERGEEFRQKVIELKRSGLKTEPAFAKLLGLDGDPWIALLSYQSEGQHTAKS